MKAAIGWTGLLMELGGIALALWGLGELSKSCFTQLKATQRCGTMDQPATRHEARSLTGPTDTP